MYAQTRRHPRIETSHPCFVERLGDQPLEMFSQTRTLGTGGCAFRSEHALGYRSLTKISLSVAGRVFNADGRVAYERPMPGGLEVGVEFLRITPEDRIHLRQIVEGRKNGA